MDLNELPKLLRENNGRYVAFENGRPDLVIFDAKKHPYLITKPSGSAKILVTGGAGFIGSHVVADLLDHEYEVIVLDNLSTGHIDNVNCPLVVGDLSDKNLLDKIFAENNIAAVIHFAGSIIVEESMLDPHKYYMNNVVTSLNLFDAMIKHGVNKLVYSSSAAVYGNPRYEPIDELHPCEPTSPYGESKLIVERILEKYFNAYNFSSVSFRYFNAAGGSPERNLGEAHPYETHLIPRVLSVANKQEEYLQVYGSDYPTPDGTAIRDYIHVKDLARAHVLALDKMKADEGNFVYNVGTGRGYSVGQIVDTVVELTGKMVTIQKSPRRPGDPPILVADVKKIKAELGFEPQHSSLEAIISSAWDFHKLKNPVPKTAPQEFVSEQ